MASGTKRTKGRSQSPAGKPETVTVKVTITRETRRKLQLEGFGRDISVGQVLDELVSRTPQRFILTDRAKGSEAPPVPSTPTAPSPGPAVGPRLSTGLLEAV